MNAIEVSNLRKSYGEVDVLQGINLNIEEGSLFALLGPNGAGKTTTVRILSTLLRYDSGSVKIFGHEASQEANKIRHRISLMGQFASVDDELTGLENLILVARLQGLSWVEAKNRADELIRAFDLGNAVNRQVSHYSGGMRRRLDIAASVVVVPDLLFLDEPTTGLDPRSRRDIWELVKTLNRVGTTVLLTTQYLEEADQLADRIVILNLGKIVADGTPTQLKTTLGSSMLRLRLQHSTQREMARGIIEQAIERSAQNEIDPSELCVPVFDVEMATKILAILAQSQISVTEFSLGQPSLDEVFLNLTEKPVSN